MRSSEMRGRACVRINGMRVHNMTFVIARACVYSLLRARRFAVSLADFAMCRPLAKRDDVSQDSDRWLAPEALLEEQFDLACDVFSFALTCAHLG